MTLFLGLGDDCVLTAFEQVEFAGKAEMLRAFKKYDMTASGIIENIEDFQAPRVSTTLFLQISAFNVQHCRMDRIY